MCTVLSGLLNEQGLNCLLCSYKPHCKQEALYFMSPCNKIKFLHLTLEQA